MMDRLAPHPTSFLRMGPWWGERREEIGARYGFSLEPAG
jgi:hypothetical protein